MPNGATAEAMRLRRSLQKARTVASIFTRSKTPLSLSAPSGFDEQDYLAANPDVREAVTAGSIDSALFHYLTQGHTEGRFLSLRAAFETRAQILEERVIALEGLEARTESLEQNVVALEDRIRTLENQTRILALKDHDQRILTLESQLVLERDRIDWVLGVAEGVSAAIEAYQKERRTSAYWSAYDRPEPLVSICVATTNRSDLLIERAMKSLASQSYRNMQIIVVGDRCTDDTQRRLVALRDSRICFVNRTERGPYPPPGTDRWRVAGSNAMNHGLSLCEGNFITHLDDDDMMTSDRIETLVMAARSQRADLLWHSFWYERSDGSWVTLGNGEFAVNQVTTGSIFYHRYFARFPWDIRAYRISEPGDWNRFRKLKLLRPRLHFVKQPLLFHFAERSQPVFMRQDGEQYLDE
jgi:hypothetical protein